MATVINVTNATVKYRQRHSLFRHSYYKALDNVSFGLKKGETLGVIGRNGCGKSTLLKLLAGIYQPDIGSVDKGEASVSLLTLAAGFDPNLSGLDNAIISGMMLGHAKADIIEQLDDIIEYSELAEFIHEPIKTYSSGMKARLGFSVAIKMNADVLLIDEVLGVGDANFKKKAEATMLSKINSEQTVVLVSHSAAQIKKVCQRAVWIEKGKVQAVGDCIEVADAYQRFLDEIKLKNKTATKKIE